MQRFVSLRSLFAGLFVLFCTLPSGFAQLSKHGNIWHFGNHAGLDFTSGVPVKINNSAMDSYEGCSSYCDANGQLLFYSNGGGVLENGANGLRRGTIWNRNNTVMYDMGQTEGGGYSSAQGVVVVPKPGSAGHYYQFMVDHNASVDVPPLGVHRGLTYFEVDRSLNGGLGGVVGTNVPVFKPAVECLTAVPNANGQDFWIITINSDSHDFVVVPVTTSGVGQPMQTNALNHPASEGSIVIKASPDGRYLCAGSDLYSFNPANGNLFYLQTLIVSKYTFSFSPDSWYLYGFESDVSVNIVRYDLHPAIPTFSQLTTAPTFTFAGLMQLGPDGNIYFVEQLEDDLAQVMPPVSLSVIRCPDSAMPQLERAIMKFPSDPVNGGVFTSLPNFADYIFAAVATPQDTVKRDICLSAVALQPSQTGLHYQWSTGDTTAQIVVTGPGTYSVAVDVAGVCAPVITLFQVRPGGAEVNITSKAIRDTCYAFPLTLHAESSQMGAFKWSDGSIADSLVITEYGTYVVTLFTACGPATDTFQLLKPQQDCCRPMFPNAFTPNGDHINDRFSAIFDQCDIDYADFFIYDRWGELVFQSYEPTEQWDGLTLNGTLSQPDVYTYTLRYKRRGQSQEQFEKGQVTLLR